MLVILNDRAAGGGGRDKWRRVETDLARVLGPFRVAETGDLAALDDEVAGALAAGERRFVAAGGDGTVNAVVAALLRRAPARARESLCVGAVGLGSSNDFHKPFRRVIQGVPCRIDFDRARPADVGAIEWTDVHGRRHAGFWVVNASIGTTAAANWTFNHPGPVLRFLKRRSTGSAIVAAAAGAILTHPPDRVHLTLDGATRGLNRIRNLGVVKNPHFTGSLSYDSPDEPDSGRFFVHGLTDVPLSRLIAILFRLSRGRFSGTSGTWSSPGTRLAVRTAFDPFHLEFDGEVVLADEALFTLMPHRMRFCP